MRLVPALVVMCHIGLVTSCVLPAERILEEVDDDGSGEVEYAEFVEIMTSTLVKLAEKQQAAEESPLGSSDGNQGDSQVSLSESASSMNHQV